MYDQVNNHFALKIEDTMYDVTGIISEDGFIPWSKFCKLDPLEAGRIFHNCIMFDD